MNHAVENCLRPVKRERGRGTKLGTYPLFGSKMERRRDGKLNGKKRGIKNPIFGSVKKGRKRGMES